MSCFSNGKKKEEEFKQALSKILEEKNINYTIEKTSFNDDVRKHIDFTLTCENKKWSFDVKAKKKVNRDDKKAADDLNWIELKNVRGCDGWLYGEATHIAFEINEGFMLVKRTDLINLIKEKCQDSTIYPSEQHKIKEIYKKYNRAGRKDVIILVPNSDLQKIQEKFIPKV